VIEGYERIRIQLYDNLDWFALSHDERYQFIFMIEGAAYCEGYGLKDMERVRHVKLCDGALNQIPNESRDSFGGTYQSISDNEKLNTVYFTVKEATRNEHGKIIKRNARIGFNYLAIKALVDSKKDGTTRLRVDIPPCKREMPRHVFESIHITDTVSCVVNAPVDKERTEPGSKTIIRKVARTSS
jgi:hypothetical protein